MEPVCSFSSCNSSQLELSEKSISVRNSERPEVKVLYCTTCGTVYGVRDQGTGRILPFLDHGKSQDESQR